MNLEGFTTISQIEVLCFFHKNKNTFYTQQAICTMLFLSETLTSNTLEWLLKNDYIIKDNQHYSYNPYSQYENSGQLEQLQDLLRDNKSKIIEILFNNLMTGNP